VQTRETSATLGSGLALRLIEVAVGSVECLPKGLTGVSATVLKSFWRSRVRKVSGSGLPVVEVTIIVISVMLWMLRPIISRWL